MFTYELARRIPVGSGITANALHPGVVATELGRYLFPSPEPGSNPPWWSGPLIAAVKKFTLTPEEGARTNIFLASSPDVQGVRGKYFDSCKPIESSSESYNIEKSKKLWEISSELVDKPLYVN